MPGVKKQETTSWPAAKNLSTEIQRPPIIMGSDSFTFPVPSPGMGISPLEVAISTCIGQRVLIKTGPLTGREGIINSFVDRKFMVRIGDDLEAFRIEDIEPIVGSHSKKNQQVAPLSPQSPTPNSHASSNSPRAPRPRRRGPKVNFVGRFVRIESGRYKGDAGYVTRGGNGYYSIKFSADSPNAHETVMKRGADLTLVTRPEDFVEGPDFEKAVAEAAAELKNSSSAVVPKKKRRNSTDSDHGSADDSPLKRRPRRNTGTSRDYWMERQVMVTAGKYRGEVGTVTRSGHGFYCVSIPGRGDVMKRATDIEICDEDNDFSEIFKDVGLGLDISGTEQAKVRRAAFILMDIRRDGQPVEAMDEPIFRKKRGRPKTKRLGFPKKSGDELSKDENPVPEASPRRGRVLFPDDEAESVKEAEAQTPVKGDLTIITEEPYEEPYFPAASGSSDSEDRVPSPISDTEDRHPEPSPCSPSSPIAYS